MLDTHAMIFAARGVMKRTALAALDEVRSGGAPVYVSAVSAWELADNARKGRSLAAQLLPTPEVWFAAYLASGVREVALTSDIAFASSRLPRLHADPLDRFIIATARKLGVPLVTRDRDMQAYADAGLLQVIPC